MINSKKVRSKNNSKVCVCTCVKGENRYIIEYINHYINYGIDTIFIYDNNDINEERNENLLNGYLKNNLVKIINFRGRSKIQKSAF